MTIRSITLTLTAAAVATVLGACARSSAPTATTTANTPLAAVQGNAAGNPDNTRAASPYADLGRGAEAGSTNSSSDRSMGGGTVGSMAGTTSTLPAGSGATSDTSSTGSSSTGTTTTGTTASNASNDGDANSDNRRAARADRN